MKRYNHPARPCPPEYDTPNECFICGVRTVGVGPTLKHHDEEVRLTTVPREYLPAKAECTRIGELALAQITERASDHERAAAVVIALISEGYLRAKRGAPPKARQRH